MTMMACFSSSGMGLIYEQKSSWQSQWCQGLQAGGINASVAISA